MNRYSFTKTAKIIEDEFEEFTSRCCEAIIQAGEEIHINIIGMNDID